MIWAKLIMVFWLVIFVAAAYCVPLLELDDFQNYVKTKHTDDNEYNEQDGVVKNDNGDQSDILLGTNYVGELLNNNEKLSELLNKLLGQVNYKDNGGEYTKEKENPYHSENIIEFRDILDEILEEIDPLESDIGPTEEQFENRNDYDSIIFDLIQSFIGLERFEVDDSVLKKNIRPPKHKLNIILGKKLIEGYKHKDLESLKAHINSKFVKKWQAHSRKSGTKIGNQKKRSKRLSSEDGKWVCSLLSLTYMQKKCKLVASKYDISRTRCTQL